MSTFCRPDTSIDYETYGDGVPVVFVMGVGAGAEGWDAQAAVVAKDRRVIVLDNRGVGRSSRSRRADYSAEACAGDVAALLDHVGALSAHVVGVSFGSAVAVALAVARPDRVRSVTIASAPFLTSNPALIARLLQGSAAAVRSLASVRAPSRGGLIGAAIRGIAQVMFSPEYAAQNDEALGREFRRALDRGVRPDVVVLQLASCMRFDMVARARAIRAPALIIAGDRDAIVPVARATALASSMPGARLAVIPAGHAVNIEAPGAFNAAILGFFAEVEAGGAHPAEGA